MSSGHNRVENEYVALLSEGQRDCLRLVFQHRSSKQIARELGISSHTVDQRLKAAMRILRVSARIDAARILAAYEKDDPYQSLVHQSPGIAQRSSPAMMLPPIDYRELHPTDIDGNAVHDVVASGQSLRDMTSPSSSWPLPMYVGERNDLSLIYRLGWIFAIAATAALAFGMILAGLDALARLI
ncbi:MAG: helix-turn-helix transcriptional regulator [Pseudomonadota bacterium]